MRPNITNYTIVILLLIFANTPIACAQSWDWAAFAYNNVNNGVLAKFSLDSGGNIYVFSHSNDKNNIKVAPDNIQYQYSNINKVDKNGVLIWSTETPDYFEVMDIRGIGESTIVVGKNYLSTFDKLTLIYYNNSGQLINTDTVATGKLFSSGCEVLPFGDDIYLILECRDLEFKNGKKIQAVLGGSNKFILKLDKNLNLQWAHEIGLSCGSFLYNKMMLKGGNLYMVATACNNALPFPHVFLYKISSSGVLVDSLQFNGRSHPYARFDMDDSLNIYLGGNIEDDANVDGHQILLANGRNFIVKLDNNFKVKWLLQAKDSVPNSFFSGLTFLNKALYVSGKAESRSNLQIGGKKVAYTERSHGFILKFSEVGNVDTIMSFTDRNGHSAFMGIGKDTCQNLYIQGGFFNSAQPSYLRLGSLLMENAPNNSTNSFIAKLNPNTIKILQRPLCNQDSLYLISATVPDSVVWLFSDSTVKKGVNILTYKKPNLYIVTAKAYFGSCNYAEVTDTFHFGLPLPKAHFTTTEQIGCQWIGYNFINQSTVDTLKPGHKLSYLWQFGDGKTDTSKNPSHIYEKAGKYTVQLIVNNGFCTDTFTQVQEVEILAAPKPGFSINKNFGCAPLTVHLQNNSMGEVSAFSYVTSNGLQDTLASPKFTFDVPGTYTIYQQLTGPTDCVTKDSATIHVIKGIGKGEKFSLHCASASEAEVKLCWPVHTSAKQYHLYKKEESKNWLLLASLSDTSFTDDAVNLNHKIYHYRVQTEDSCGNKSDFGNEGNTILLSGTSTENEFADLQWNAYQNWTGTYSLSTVDDIGNTSNFFSGNTLHYRHDSFYVDGKLERCYQIMAQNGSCSTFSNILCLPFHSLLFFPNAFSPNTDSLNEFFFPNLTAFKTITFSIYNRWGEKLFETNEVFSKGWDGNFKNKPAEEGMYLYRFIGRDARNKAHYKNGHFYLLK